MGEAADLMGAMKAAEQYQRAQNRESAPRQLAEAGIEFKVFNGGAHLRINAKGFDIDFWPGTGRWKATNKVKLVLKHGIKSLIQFCTEGNDD